MLDVGSGGGYLALLFSSLVGETGHVDIHNTPGWINQFPGMDPDAPAPLHQARQYRLHHRRAGTTSASAPSSYDVIVMGQVYHDALLEGANISS